MSEHSRRQMLALAGGAAVVAGAGGLVADADADVVSGMPSPRTWVRHTENSSGVRATLMFTCARSCWTFCMSNDRSTP